MFDYRCPLQFHLGNQEGQLRFTDFFLDWEIPIGQYRKVHWKDILDHKKYTVQGSLIYDTTPADAQLQTVHLKHVGTN